MSRGRNINWNDLRYFLRAAQSQSLSAAARVMGVKHTTIGRRLSALERTLGVPLMIRRPDGLRLTALGANVLPLIEDVERLVLAVGEIVVSQRAHVRLAAPSGFSRLFSESLEELRKKHPEISLEIVSGARTVDLKKNEADLAIRLGPIADHDLIARRIGEAGFSLYASEAYLRRRPAPADPYLLSGQPVIGYEGALARSPAARWLDEHAAGAEIVFRGNEMTDVIGAALGGAGLAVLPCAWGDEEPALIRVTSEVLAVAPVSVVYPREARQSETMRAVIRYVTAVMRRHAR